MQMKNEIINTLRQTFRKIFKKDFLIINQDSEIHRFAGMVIISKSNGQNGYLPVRYNYHTPKNWRLQYEISGNATGTLHYSIKAPEKPPFFEIVSDVKLPQIWTVELVGNHLKVNDVIHEVKGIIPLDTTKLFADFKFTSGNRTLWRKVGHRIKLEDGDLDEEYFNKNVYKSYETESAHFPPEIFSKIERFHKLDGKLLDIGCATGLLVKYALAQGLEAEGIDSSSWAVQKANEKTNNRCRVIDFNQAKKSDFSDSYDFITLNSVLEHLENPKHALELLFELCKKNGIVYIQTLNSDSLMHQIMKSDWGGYTDYTHKSPGITAKWLTTTAQSLGFEIAYEHKYHVWNDNQYDDVWIAFSSMLKIYPISTLLEEKFGDIVEIIIQHP
jgi:2-polyprenyl-3-methyl-5-hydroxy-6-metoxy-1,4-benzoquinol methylase